MPDSVAPATPAAGLFTHFSALLAAKLAYVRARAELAGIEGKEAAVHYGVILGLAIGGLILLVFGYFFLVIALVFLIALAFDSDGAWIWVTFGAAITHFLIAAALVMIAKGKLAAPMFATTLEELRKDQEWLKTTANPR